MIDRPRPLPTRQALAHGEMALRWPAAGMLAAGAQFRRVRGFKQMPHLVAALEALTADEPGLLDIRHAVTA